MYTNHIIPVHLGPERPLSLHDIVNSHVGDDATFETGLSISINQLEQTSSKVS